MREQRNIILQNKTNGILNHLNYPQSAPPNTDYIQHIVAPLGEVILLEFRLYNVGISETGCHSAERIEVCKTFTIPQYTKFIHAHII